MRTVGDGQTAGVEGGGVVLGYAIETYFCCSYIDLSSSAHYNEQKQKIVMEKKNNDKEKKMKIKRGK